MGAGIRHAEATATRTDLIAEGIEVSRRMSVQDAIPSLIRTYQLRNSIMEAVRACLKAVVQLGK